MIFSPGLFIPSHNHFPVLYLQKGKVFVNISEIIDSAVTLSKEHPVIAVVAVLLILYLLVRKPKVFFGLALLATILAVIWYFISDISTVGKSKKEQMIEKGIHPGMADRP